MRLGPNASSLTALSDSGNPATNFFNSSMMNLGTRYSAKNPDYVNQLGFDADIVQTTTALTNNQTSATIRLDSSSDTYYPGVVTFSTPLHTPVFDQTLTKTVTDVTSPGTFAPGDTLEYTITATNTGDDTADNVVLTDPLPSGMTYTPRSLSSGASIATLVSRTDAAGDDVGEYVAGVSPIRRRQAGHRSDLFRRRFALGGRQLCGPLPCGARFRPQRAKRRRRRWAELHEPVRRHTLLLVVPRHHGDRVGPRSGHELKPRRRVRPGHVRQLHPRGPDVGSQTATGPVKVTDTLPAGIVPGSASGVGWNCSTVSATVTCTHAGDLAVGASLPAITVPITIGESAASSSVNAPTVSNGSDTNPANDTASDSTTVTSNADISTTISQSPSSVVAAGSPLVYTITTTNNGPSAASGVTTTDMLPAGVTFNTASSSQGSCSGTTTVSCAVGALASGQSATITISVTPPGALQGTTLQNSATSAANETDPNASNNTSATVDATIEAALPTSACPSRTARIRSPSVTT